MHEHIERIRVLNDEFRRTFLGGRVLLTTGVNALPQEARIILLQKVQGFDTFDLSNDPYHEHDFLRVEMEGQTYFAKIDYYDLGMTAGSEDPSNPAKTIRVLTIMCADEY